MFSPGILKIFRRLLPAMMWEGEDKNAVYLTIDDGPTPEITPSILEILERYNVKATFFCLGKNVDQHPDLYRMILDAGHKTGNHSYSHVKGWRMSSEHYVEDADLAAQLIRSELFRPPYGRITKRQAEVLSRRYTLVMGNVISEDYNRSVVPSQCLANVTRGVRGGSIVVFHDSSKSFRNASYALPRAIEYIKKMGLEFKTLGTPPESAEEVF